MLDGIFMTMSTSTGLYPKLDLWTANKLQLQLQFTHSQFHTCLSFVIIFDIYLFIYFIKHSVNPYIQGNNPWDIEFVVERNNE